MGEGARREFSTREEEEMKTVLDRPRVLSASTPSGDPVRNAAGEDLGKIGEFMIGLETGKIAYAWGAGIFRYYGQRPYWE